MSLENPKCPNIFEKIYAGHIPSRQVYKNDHHGIDVIADIKPTGEGHLLIFPLACVEMVDDLPSDLRDKLFTVSTYAGRVLKRTFGSDYVGQLIAGNEVPHAHVHRVPGDPDADWMKRFGKALPRLDIDSLPMDDILDRITHDPRNTALWEQCSLELDQRGPVDSLTLRAFADLPTIGASNDR